MVSPIQSIGLCRWLDSGGWQWPCHSLLAAWGALAYRLGWFVTKPRNGGVTWGCCHETTRGWCATEVLIKVLFSPSPYSRGILGFTCQAAHLLIPGIIQVWQAPKAWFVQGFAFSEVGEMGIKIAQIYWTYDEPKSVQTSTSSTEYIVLGYQTAVDINTTFVF